MTEDTRTFGQEMDLESPEFAEPAATRSAGEEANRCCGKQPEGEGEAILPACGPCETTKSFCCTVTVIEEFAPETFSNTRLVWDVSELACFVERCSQVCPVPGCPDVTTTFFAVRIRGCIEFIASAEVQPSVTPGKTCGGLFTTNGCREVAPGEQDRKYFICCQGSTSVDQVLKVFSSRLEAELFCRRFNGLALLNPGVSCPDTPMATHTVSVNSFCVRTRDCGQDTDCPPSGNVDVTFCGEFQFNFPDC